MLHEAHFLLPVGAFSFRGNDDANKRKLRFLGGQTRSLNFDVVVVDVDVDVDIASDACEQSK